MIEWFLRHWTSIISGVVAAVVATVLIRLFGVFLTRPLKWIWRRFRRLHYALQVFPKGTVECLSKKHLAHKATMERIRHFYEGGILGWDIIAANGDVERDQMVALLEELEKSKNELRLICVVGSAWAGKSTLAWRAAAELFKKGYIVLWIRRSNEPEVWFKMSEFYERIRKPFYVLADDLFRDPEVVEALRQLDSFLPIAIIATSRYGELARSRLPFPMVQVPLAAPSPGERERALKSLLRKPS